MLICIQIHGMIFLDYPHFEPTKEVHHRYENVMEENIIFNMLSFSQWKIQICYGGNTMIDIPSLN